MFGTMVQAEPSQCRISVLGSVKLVGCCVPTAHTSFEATAATPARLLSTSGPTFGLGITLHAVPFQCKVAVALSSPITPLPTAQISFPETTARAATLVKGQPSAVCGCTL